VLAEFIYGGKVAPTFPSWFIDSTQPSALSWFLKEKLLPPLYWYAMLKGHEWIAAPIHKNDLPTDMSNPVVTLTPTDKGVFGGCYLTHFFMSLA
jgi:hypothetical protein